MQNQNEKQYLPKSSVVFISFNIHNINFVRHVAHPASSASKQQQEVRQNSILCPIFYSDPCRSAILTPVQGKSSHLQNSQHLEDGIRMNMIIVAEFEIYSNIIVKSSNIHNVHACPQVTIIWHLAALCRLGLGKVAYTTDSKTTHLPSKGSGLAQYDRFVIYFKL